MALKCRLDIKEGLVDKAIDMYKTANIKVVSKNTLFVPNRIFKRSGQDYQIAESIIRRANRDFGGPMAYRIKYMDGQQVVFDPSDEVVDQYYETYLKQVAYEGALSTQQEDAARAGEEFKEDYLFDTDPVEIPWHRKARPQDKLLHFLTNYGFEITDAENLVVDLANKKIDLDTADITQVSVALAEPLAEMLSYSDFFYAIEKEVVDTPKFKEYLAKHEAMYPDSTKRNLKRLAAKDVFKDLLENGFNERLAKEQYQIPSSVLKKIVKFLQEILTALKGADYSKIKYKIDKIVENTFKGEDFIRLTKKEGYKQVKFQEAFDENSIAKDIMTKIGTNPSIILTGSIAYSTQGTVYRKMETVVHDLDFVNQGLTEKEVDELVMSNYPDSIKAYSFFDKYQVDTYLVPPSGISIVDLKRRDTTNKIVSYKLADSSGNIVGTYELQYDVSDTGKTINEVEIKQGVEAMLVDFFSNDNQERTVRKHKFVGSDGKSYDVNLSHFAEPFEAKLSYSRFKDIWDYNRFIPFDRTESFTENDLLEDLDNLNFTDDVIYYLYDNSSKRMDLDEFGKQVQVLAVTLQGIGYNNQDIIEKLKCL